MKASKTRLVAAGIVFVTLLMSFAAPASAASAPGPLAPGDSIHVLPWGQPNAAPQLFSVDMAGVTASIGTVGPGKPYAYYWAGAAFDPTDGKYYIVDNNVGLLWQVDPATGTFTEALQMKYLDGQVLKNFNNAYALAIAADGTTYLSDGSWGLYRLNRSTGLATELAQTGGFGIATLAIHPESGKIYGGGGNGIIEITPSATSATFTTITNSFSGNINAMQFDSNGTLWFVGTGNICSADITNLGAGAACSPSFSGAYVKQPYSILITSAPQHIVSFDPNGGVGTMEPQVSASETTLTKNTFTRSGYTFVGWSTTATGAVQYADNAAYPFGTSATLYAQWRVIPVLAETGVNVIDLRVFAVGAIFLGAAALMLIRRKKHG